MNWRLFEMENLAAEGGYIKSIKLKNIFLYLTCLAFLTPVAVNLGYWDGKPIDVVLSDIWLVFFFCGVFLGFIFNSIKVVKPNAMVFLVFLPVFYYILMGTYGGVTGGGLSNLLSMVRFIKQFIFLIAGWLLYGIYERVLPACFIKICLMFFLVTFVSSFYYGDFPMGCGAEGRWGGCIFSLDVYGFPNSAASYFVLLLGMLMYCASIFQRYRGFIVAAMPVIFVMIFLTLSRAAWVYLAWVSFFGWLFLVDRSKKIRFLVIGACLLGLAAFLFSLYENTELGFNALGKIERNISSDPSSGRFAIWSQSIALIKERPFLGYGFSYFSNYVQGYDTPHNQYLEILFKAGIVGLFGYALFLMLMWHLVKRRKNSLGPGGAAFLGCGVLGGLIFNGMFQPIFSYSVVANLFMAVLGYLAAATWNKDALSDHSDIDCMSK